MNKILLVFVGGGIGSLARFGMAMCVKKYFFTSFPLATFLSNVFSCLVMALVILLLSEKMISQPTLRLFIITGFCGGFSTFSAFSFETVELIKSGNAALAALNVFMSLTVCFALIFFILKNS